MKNALLERLERSYKTAQRQQKNGWQSDDAPKIGIHLIIATQYSPAKLHEAFLALMRNRIVLRCNEDASLALLGNTSATTLARGQYNLLEDFT